MTDIKELIAIRQRNDPSFRVLREPRGKRFFLRDQIILSYPTGTSLRNLELFARQFAEAIYRPKFDAKKTWKEPELKILATGTVLVKLTDAALGGTIPPPPPPPPPPWYPADIKINYLHVALALVGNFKTAPVLVDDFQIESTSILSGGGIT